MNFFRNLLLKSSFITLATVFTILRILLTPCIVGTMVMNQWGVAFIFFLMASVTDGIDGALARFYNIHTFFGACLDAIADKFLLISCYTALAFIKSPLFTIPLWFVTLVLLKEFILIGGFLLLYYKNGFAIRPTLLSKVTTFLQIVFIVWLFACYFFNWLPIKTYYGALGFLICFVLATLGHYIMIGITYTIYESRIKI